MISYRGQLRCKERESSHRLGGFWRVCIDWESGVLEGPESGMEEDMYTYICCCMHRKPQLYSLELSYTFSLDHYKACIRMVM
jgi:hypothetical protein